MGDTTDTLKTRLARQDHPIASQNTVAGVTIDWGAIWRTLGLDPQMPDTQALLLVCERYGLDPLLKHAVLIDGKVYVTRDGLLHRAHTSGVFDGIEVVEGPTEQDNGDWVAKVAVHRKDMALPITYPGRYPSSGRNRAYRPEMAIKVAEVMSLRRAFDVAVATVEEQWDTLTSADYVDVDAEPVAEQAEPSEHEQLKYQVASTAYTLAELDVITQAQVDRAVASANESPEKARNMIKWLDGKSPTEKDDS
jgi:hypothetical protein